MSSNNVTAETTQVFEVRIPKNHLVQEFTFYVLHPTGDKYAEKTVLEKISFDPQDTVIDIYNQGVVEKHLNEVAAKIYQFDLLLGKVNVLLQALEREEAVYSAKKYNEVTDKKLTTVESKKNFVLADSFQDATGLLFNNYIAKSKFDVMALTTCIKVLTSHQFKCKQIYDVRYGKRSGQNGGAL